MALTIEERARVEMEARRREAQKATETASERFERITGEQARRVIEGQRERLGRLRRLRPTCLKVGEVDRDFRLALDAVVFDSEVVKVTHGGGSKLKVLGVLLSDDDYNALFRAAMLQFEGDVPR